MKNKEKPSYAYVAEVEIEQNRALLLLSDKRKEIFFVYCKLPEMNDGKKLRIEI